VTNPYPDLERTEATYEGVTRTVFRGGTGPAVIVMHEIPGLYPSVVAFGKRLMAAGMTVYFPSMFGTPGREFSTGYMTTSLMRACVSREFATWATRKTSPIVTWLRALARDAHAACGGPGVGAIGMCFTGNFALTMMLESSMLAPVLAQPSLPLNDPAGLEIAPDDLKAVRARLDRDDLTVMAYRFAGDRFCTAQRFAAYTEALGDRFIGRVLPDVAANTDLAPFFAERVASPHSVVTAHLIDEAGQPTIAARDEILEFFGRRLRS
jgi:dienelactone hydrolase